MYETSLPPRAVRRGVGRASRRRGEEAYPRVPFLSAPLLLLKDHRSDPKEVISADRLAVGKRSAAGLGRLPHYLSQMISWIPICPFGVAIKHGYFDNEGFVTSFSGLDLAPLGST